jgi:hypothetical protein
MDLAFFKTSGILKKDLIFVNILIHTFAVVHALACFLLRFYGFDDGLALTILTIAMIVLLINYFSGATDVFLSLSLLSCLAGFYLGTKGAILLGYLLPNNPLLTHIIATFLVTESLGWLVYFILRRRSKRR